MKILDMLYTDFVYPGELISGIGENVCSVLDKIKIKNVLGNFEYFYDIDGILFFKKLKIIWNNSYDATEYRLNDEIEWIK